MEAKRIIERGNRWIKSVRIGGKRSDRVLLLIFAFLFVECSCAIVRDPVSEFVKSQQTHRIPCWLLPTDAEVKEVLERHADDVRRIEAIPDVVRKKTYASHGPVHWWAPPQCSGRSDITWTIQVSVSDYSRYAKKRIMTIIGDDVHFHGVPYNILVVGY